MTETRRTVLIFTDDDLRFLEAALQRDAVGLIKSLDQVGVPAYETQTYKKNRELFGRVWDALNDRPGDVQ